MICAQTLNRERPACELDVEIVGAGQAEAPFTEQDRAIGASGVSLRDRFAQGGEAIAGAAHVAQGGDDLGWQGRRRHADRDGLFIAEAPLVGGAQADAVAVARGCVEHSVAAQLVANNLKGAVVAIADASHQAVGERVAAIGIAALQFGNDCSQRLAWQDGLPPQGEVGGGVVVQDGGVDGGRSGD